MASSLIPRIWHFITYFVPNILNHLFNLILRQASSRYIDLRSALMVAIIRTVTADPTPVSMEEMQRRSITFEEVDESIKVEPVTFHLPSENNIAEAVRDAIIGLGDCAVQHVSQTVAQDVRAERLMDTRMVGDREDGSAGDGMSYIYLHGGQFFMRNAASMRPLVSKLVEGSPARCFSIEYRLAPQDPFPAALVDTLVTYLSLLYPEAGSHLHPVPATSIGVCGDSCGGNLAAAFLQLLLHWQRTGQKIEFGGRAVQVPLPAGAAIHSGYMDLARSLPSEEKNLAFDVIPSAFESPFPVDKYIQDSTWPCNSPRHHVYAPTSLISHPLVSPTAATDWRNCPTRVWFGVGEECLADGNIVLAKAMAQCGIHVRLDVYRGMPHNFLVQLPSGVQGRACGAHWKKALFESCDVGKMHDKMLESDGVQAVVYEPDGQGQVQSLEEMGPQLSPIQVKEGMEQRVRSWGVPASRIKH